MHPEAVAFLLGVAGSLSLELLRVLRAYERGRMPQRYRLWGFWAVRVLMSLMAGLIAWATYTPGLNRLVYIDIGAAAPALLVQFAAGPPDISDQQSG